jgi:hypothetical protein
VADDAGQFDRRSAERIAEATRYVESMQRNDAEQRPRRHRRGGEDLRLALTTTDHAPDATEEVSLRKADWSDTGKTVEAVNDTEAEIPEGSRVYIARIAGQWRIVPLAVSEGGHRVEVKVGKPDEDISKGTWGDVTVWEGEPDSLEETDPPEVLPAYALARKVFEGKFVVLTRHPGMNSWFVDCWEE